MSGLLSRSAAILATFALGGSLSEAQTVGAPPTDASTSAPMGSAASAAAPSGAFTLQSALLASTDRQVLVTALAYAKRGDASGARSAMSAINDNAARKLVLWAMVDIDGEQLTFDEADQARRMLAGWPHAQRRQAVAEKLLDSSGLGPGKVIDWFGGAEPQSPQGAMALAAAYEQSARRPDAQALIQRWWRTKTFEAGDQRAMLSRFGDLLTQDDHVKRADALLYGQQGPAARDMLSLLPDDQRALAQARMALRENAWNAQDLASRVPASLAQDPGLVFERARYLRAHNQDAESLALVPGFPGQLPNGEGASRIWTERKALIGGALRAGDYHSAYAAATNHGLTDGSDYTEAEFYAGWLALSKLHDPAAADGHFANIQRAGVSPITLSRALFWRGRAAEARGDAAAAKAFYSQGARFQTTFYGQLAAEKAGATSLDIGHDPQPTATERAEFAANDLTRAENILADLGERDLFRSFVLSTAQGLSAPDDDAMLIDLAMAHGDQDLAMRVVRIAAQMHGIVFPERGYPIRAITSGGDQAEPAMVFGITRQESNFDPRVRSNVGARGMMQLMPETARAVARRSGEPYESGMLDDPSYNMRLGGYYLGHLISDFGGSYVLATAAYNAGPGRPADWATYCGDPRASGVDPVDFIECIPFSETRNYVMRVMEAAEVYRARLNGGTAPLTLAEDLKRGVYTYGAAPPPMPTSNDPIAALIEANSGSTPPR